MTYSDQYKHPKWQKRRLDYIGWMLAKYDYDVPFCESCGDDESQLHLHHLLYIKDRKVWEYNNDELILLCGNCHSYFHDLQNELKYELSILCGKPEIAQLLLNIVKKFRKMNPAEVSELIEKIDSWRAG